MNVYVCVGLLRWPSDKESDCSAGDWGLNPERDPLEKEWPSTPVFLPGEFYGQRSLAGLQSMGSHRIRHD